MGIVLIFVYGTLRKGCQRHAIVEPYKCITNEAQLRDFAMYNLGPFPTITRENGSLVKGEVYKIPDATLEILDFIEGYNKALPQSSLFQRIQVTAESLDGAKYRCFAYALERNLEMLRADEIRKVDSGNWLEVAGASA